jgi:hypothetical protein
MDKRRLRKYETESAFHSGAHIGGLSDILGVPSKAKDFEAFRPAALELDARD